MDEAETAAAAQQAVASLMEALGIVRVVFVDDTNPGTVNLEDVVAAASNLDGSILIEEFPELGDSVPEDIEVRTATIRGLWDDLEDEVRIERGRGILVAARRQDGDGEDDLADLSILGDLIPAGRLCRFTPREWNDQQEGLLNHARSHKTLFLFDRDLSEDGGDVNGGMRIIASLLHMEDSDQLICGLLTHTVTPETQEYEWATLSTQHDIPKDRFVVIPKIQLSKEPLLFARALKIIALSPEFVALKREAARIITDSSVAAAERIEDISIDDLEHIVFRVAADEGLWEPDMLFRLHALVQRDESRRLAHTDGGLESIAAKVRSVSEIPIPMRMPNQLYPKRSGARTLQRQELYEMGSHINSNHLPLELGDVFEKIGSESAKRYVLLAQPCDLMVRGSGKRQPEQTRLPLAEVVCSEAEPAYAEEMPYFDEDVSRKWFVNLKRIHQVRVDVLDYCVFNTEGVARFDLDKQAPATIRPAWKKRHAVLIRRAQKEITRLGNLYPSDADAKEVVKFKSENRVKLVRIILKEDLFEGEVEEIEDGQVMSYNCRRLMRMARERALGLLMSYTATLGRPAYEREFGQVLG